MDAGFSRTNNETEEGIEQPRSANFSGSPESLIPWETLGAKGRTFAASAISKEEIESFHKKPAMEPIRIYGGLQSAPDIRSRAKLAVQDLKRAGGFQRKVLVVASTTGTGWVDRLAIEPLEYLHQGDTATIALQYSYLPSVFSFFVDGGIAKVAGVELFSAVHDEWLSMPEEKRPKLLSFGESLGSYATEAAFPTVASFKACSHGALLIGPPNANPIWSEILTHREEGTPIVLPIVGKGKTVRFARRPEDFDKPKGSWEEPRAVYLHNPSDPIVWWSKQILYKKPDWLKEPLGADINKSMFWLPLVTFLQLSGDFAASVGPPGHGHRYGDLTVDAWAIILPPDGWTDEKTKRLKEII